MSSGCHCLDKVACVKVGCNELDLSVHSQGVVINSMKPRNFASGDRSVVPPHDLFVCANVVVRQDDQLDGSTVVLVVLMKGSKDCWEEHCEASKSGSAAQLVDLAAPHIDTNIDSSAALKTSNVALVQLVNAHGSVVSSECAIVQICLSWDIENVCRLHFVDSVSTKDEVGLSRIDVFFNLGIEVELLLSSG